MIEGKAYLATHFFNEPVFEWTAKVAKKIREELPKIDLYVPQENGEINDKKNNDDIITDVLIAQADNARLKEANILFAHLDGVEIDSGVSSEIGYTLGRAEAEAELSALPKPRFIIGIYTDMRQDGTGDNHHYINLYTKGNVKCMGIVVRTVEEAIFEAQKFCNRNGISYDSIY